MARRELKGARCLITGASSGIGWDLALALGRRGVHLIVTARRTERLEELTRQLRSLHVEATSIAGDVTDAELRERLAREVMGRWGALDLLVNNAGSGAWGLFADSDAERMRRMFEIDFFAPVELARRCHSLLRSGRRPLLVNMGSVLGHRAVPYKSEYCAAKFALHGWSDSIRAEWAREGIQVLLVSPSTTGSEFFGRVEVSEGVARPMGGSRLFPPTSPAVVARQVVRAMERGRDEAILSLGGKMLVWADRLCPTLMNRLLALRGSP